MIVCLAVTEEGLADPRWGRAERVAVAEVSPNGIENWREFDVGWGTLRESGTEGSHHARVARFLREHQVDAVVADHMGSDMEHMLGKLGVEVRFGVSGGAREAALATRDGGRGAGQGP
jgi:predicted Fe-Mo cluster-binding NifX family protein